MKRLGQCLLGCVFAALLILSCRALVERPEADETAPLPPPVRAVLHAASEAVPAEDMAVHHLPGQSARWLLPALCVAAMTPVNLPVRDGNGIPLKGLAYVRAAYTACRLEGASG